MFFLFIVSLLVFSGCDYQGSYTFKVKNSTEDTITLKFVNNSSYERYDENNEEVILLSAEEKTVRIVDAPLNSAAHDCLTEHGIGFFEELVFDTYVNDEKLEKQLWQSENWTYHKNSKYSADYYMTITNKMIKQRSQSK
jgi:hypothetical protein